MKKAEKQNSRDELNTIPKALNDLTAYFLAGEGRAVLESFAARRRILFGAAGDLIHAAAIIAARCRLQGCDAQAYSTAELLHWPETLFQSYDLISLMFEDPYAEDAVLLGGKLQSKETVIFSGQADVKAPDTSEIIFPLFGGNQGATAFSQFFTALVFGWLIEKQLSHQEERTKEQQLKKLRQRLQLLQDGREALLRQWQACLEGMEDLILMSNYLVQPAAAFLSSRLALRSGHQTVDRRIDWRLLETDLRTQNNRGFVLLQSETTLSENEKQILSQLAQTGARVVYLRDGFPQLFGEPPRPPAGLEEGLELVLNLFSAEILAALLDENFQKPNDG